jgi:hypothetical protein
MSERLYKPLWSSEMKSPTQVYLMKHQGDHAKDQRCFFGSYLIERCELVLVTQDRIKRPNGKLKGKGN